jgi:hypothetical protein
MSSASSRAGRYAILFVLLCVVYHSNLRPVASGDSLPASLIPFSVILDKSISLDRFGPYISEHVWYGSQVILHKGGHWYSRYPIAGPLLITPLYLPLALIPGIEKQPPSTLISIARVGEKIAAVFLASATAIALLSLLRRLTSGRAAWMLTLLFALGTANWSTSSQALWPHTFGQLAIIGCLYAVDRWSAADFQVSPYWIAGAFAACAVAIRPTNVTLLPALALALFLRPARPLHYVRVFLPVILAAAPLLAYNFAVFRSASGQYPVRVGEHLWDGLLGVLVSPGRGLLVYTPVVIFALAAFAPHVRAVREQHRLLVVVATVFALSHILLISLWPIWWGGYCWGPRLLTEAVAPCMVLLAVAWQAIAGNGWKWAFAATAIYCCFVQALGVYCYPKGRWDGSPVSVNDDPSRLWNWADNPLVRTAQGGVAWEPYAIVAAAAKGGFPAAAKKLKELEINPF